MLDCHDIQSRMTALKTLKEQFDTAYTKASLSKELNDLKIAKDLKKQVEQEMKDLRDILPIVHVESANEILGKEVFGKDAILTAFGIDLKEADIPPIPFTPKELEQAQQEGWSLILRINKDNEGNPMTMKHIAKLAQARMTEGDGKSIYYNSLLLHQSFFTSQDYALTTSWTLVANSFVPDIRSPKDDQGHYTKDITNNNYIYQTKLLRDYLLSLDLITSEQAQACSDVILEKLSHDVGIDWNTQNVTDEKIYHQNRRTVFKKLIQLSINQQFRRSPSEILYDILIRFMVTKERGYLEYLREWSYVSSADGFPISLGLFVMHGVDGIREPITIRANNIGVSFSRKASLPS